MKTTFNKRIAQAVLGGVLATALIAGAPTSAERGGDFASAPQEPIEEHILTVLTDRDTRTLTDLRVVSTGEGGRTATGFKATTGATNSGPGGPTDLKAGPGCSIQCITSGVAYARGPNAKLVVKTDTPARIWIHVQGPNNYYRVLNSGADEVMQFGALFDDLQAGTTYQAWAVAKDTQNYESARYGSFTTLTRNVKISFSNADIIQRAYDSSTFKSNIWMQGGWRDQPYSAAGLVAEGSYLGLGIYFEQLNEVDRYLDFAIQLYEGTNGCNNFGHKDQVFHGPASCSFLSFAALLDGQNDLDARPADATSWTEWTLARTLQRPSGLWPIYSPELLFTVPVSLHVTYTPLY